MKKEIKYLLIALLVIVLFLIRGYESQLFYDPLTVYFQNNYLYQTMPELDVWRLVVNILFRYILNSLVTLGIVFLAFNKKIYIKFTGFFLMSAFIILIVLFVFLLKTEFNSGYLFPFYVRRFLIHPLFLMLLFPAFYYQKLYKKKQL